MLSMPILNGEREKRSLDVIMAITEKQYLI